MKLFKRILLVLASVTCAFGFCAFTASNDGKVSAYVAQTAEIVDGGTEEQPPESTEENENEHTFDDFLAWAEKEAKNYGYGDEFTAAVEAIKTAATEKQVTLSTIASVALASFVVVMIIVMKVREGKWKKALLDLSTRMKALVDGTNGLIDETTKAEGEVEKTEKAAEETKSEVKALKKGVTALVKGFMHFIDGTKLQGTKKEEVQSDCMTALKSLDEVASNEDNEE